MFFKIILIYKRPNSAIFGRIFQIRPINGRIWIKIGRELQDIHPILDLYLFSYMRTCAAYDSTVRSIGFDEVRVRYRQQRRGLIREIITNQLHGKSLKEFISSEMEKLVKKEDQAEFFQDIQEDLKYLDLSRIAGLGITPDQLNSYLRRARASHDFVDQ